jgi:hypothetical protein
MVAGAVKSKTWPIIGIIQGLKTAANTVMKNGKNLTGFLSGFLNNAPHVRSTYSSGGASGAPPLAIPRFFMEWTVGGLMMMWVG